MFQRVVTLLLAASGCGGMMGGDAPADANLIDAEQFGPCQLPTLAQTVATLSGCSQSGTTDGLRGESRFSNPTNVAITPNGDTYVTDFDSDRLRVIDRSGNTSTAYQTTNFQKPFGIVVRSDGKLYVETDDNDRGAHSLNTGSVWLFDPATKTAELVGRDLGRPRGLAVLADGRIAMADHIHHTVSILDPTTHQVTILAGALDQPGYVNAVGGDARFAQPYDIVVLLDGSLAVTDMDNHRVRKVTLDGTVTDLAGSGNIGALNGPAMVATFDAPQGLAISSNGALFVTDVKRKIVRRIAGGAVTTVAGDGTPGWLDAIEPRNARFYGLEGVDVDASRLVLADGNVGDGKPYNHVRVIQLSQLP